MKFGNSLKEEMQKFNSVDSEGKKEMVKNWVSVLAVHYDYFNDLKIYIDNHESELDEEFLEAVFQIVVNLAKEIEKL